MFNKSGKPSFAIPIVLGIIGVCLLAVPLVSDFITTYQATQTVSDFEQTVEKTENTTLTKMLEGARAYNARLADGTEKSEGPAYADLLNVGQSGQMGWISIPKIAVELPVYHGAGDAVLSMGVGHIEGTSLPVGGASTHCALTGHSGLSTERMFDDIRKLEEGDVFIVHVLDQDLAYRVYGSEVVMPEETDRLAVQQGRDICTLVTCTPPGANDRRLLVHGERVEYDEEVQAAEPEAVAVYVNDRTVPFVAAIVALVITAIVIAILLSRHKKSIQTKKTKMVRSESAQTPAAGKEPLSIVIDEKPTSPASQLRSATQTRPTRQSQQVRQPSSQTALPSAPTSVPSEKAAVSQPQDAPPVLRIQKDR